MVDGHVPYPEVNVISRYPVMPWSALLYGVVINVKVWVWSANDCDDSSSNFCTQRVVQGWRQYAVRVAKFSQNLLHCDASMRLVDESDEVGDDGLLPHLLVVLVEVEDDSMN